MLSRTSAIESGAPTFVSRRPRITGSATTRPSCSTVTAVTGRPMKPMNSVWASTEGQTPKFKVKSKCRIQRRRTTFVLTFNSEVCTLKSESMSHSHVERVCVVFVLGEHPRESIALVVLQQDDLIAGGRDKAA